MKRGEIWTVSGGGEYTNKPRPCLILQSGDFTNSDSIIIATLTSEVSKKTIYRYLLIPDENNGLNTNSLVMVDKLSSIKITNLGKNIGLINGAQMAMIEMILSILLGLNRS